jgi:hypothetical protein
LVAGLKEGAEVLTFEKVVTLLTSLYNGVMKRTWSFMAAPVRSKRTHGPGIHALKRSYNVIQRYVLRRSGKLVASRGVCDSGG